MLGPANELVHDSNPGPKPIRAPGPPEVVCDTAIVLR
jgi:hypothetical protein